MATKFNPEIELQDTGKTYSYYGTYYGYPYSDIPILNSPITPRENWFRAVRGEDYEWVPDCVGDIYDITPDIIPDVVACGFNGGLDNFGVEWVPLENGLPAMVPPGKPMLEDISEWREKLVWPDVDSWDWEGASKNYEKSVNEGRFNRGILLSGFFERLISLMDFDGAAIAMITEPEEVRAFFEKLADHNIAIIEHYRKYLKTDGIMLHDDWGSQRSAFFSTDTFRETIMEPYKRVVQRTHELGMLFIAHCCGNALDFVPYMVECGVDSWQMQPDASDPMIAKDLAQGKLKLECPPPMPEDLAEEDTEQYIYDYIKRHDNELFYSTMDPVTYMLTPELRKLIYKVDRTIANEK